MQTSAEVDAWFDDLEHPLEDALLRAREVILEAVVRAWCALKAG